MSLAVQLFLLPVLGLKDYVVPKSCQAHVFGPRARMSFPTKAKSYEKVCNLSCMGRFENVSLLRTV